MPDHLSKRSSILFVVGGVLALIILVLGVKFFFSGDASLPGDQFSDVESRLKKLETKVAALEFHIDNLPVVIEKNEQIEADLSAICDREGVLLSRLGAIEERLGITSQAAQAEGAQPEKSEQVPDTATLEKSTAPAQETTVEAAATDDDKEKPAAETVLYEVKKGDTVYSISRAHGITPEKLRALNGLNSNTIMPGQTLNVAP